jgi:drug/metabolite transporter (DMT)-like permease
MSGQEKPTAVPRWATGLIPGMVAAFSSGAGLALLSALLFGASTPLAKLLLRGIDPWMLAGLLYLGSGLGLIAVRAMARVLGSGTRGEAAIRGSGWMWLALATLSGGVVGPVLLMFGLAQTAATTAALLLNLEGVLTALLAWFVFRENFDRRIALGMVAIVTGGVVLTWGGRLILSAVLGPLMIAGACLAWAIDNNLTRKVSQADPVQIALLKGCVAGMVNVAIAFGLGSTLPPLDLLGAAVVVGFAGYGVSLVLFVVALRHIGAARTGAYFSLAPFFGGIVAILVLREPVTVQIVAAGSLMALGVWLHLTERHEHEHSHEDMAHEHRHVHDQHHQHSHDGTEPPGEPHSHWHLHVQQTHSHAHFPDIHHRHEH